MTGEAPYRARVVVGRLGAAFGIRGELKCKPTSAGADAFCAGRVYSLGPEPGARELRCRSVRRHHDRLLLAFDAIGTPEAARSLSGAELYAEREAIPLAEGEFFDADLIGLRLVDGAGETLGTVVAVEHYPAQDCLVVGPQRALVPLVKAFIRNVDLALGVIVTSLPEGLLDR